MSDRLIERLGLKIADMKTDIRELQTAFDQMVVAWSFGKIEVCDSELTESWVVETLLPDNAQQFYEALDNFSVLWTAFSRKHLVSLHSKEKEVE